jgi:VWFA-related protein
MNTLMRRSWAALSLVPLVALAQDQPVIRVGTRLVEVDVVVRDKKGPVADLTKDDFSLFDQGKPQRIAVFSLTTARNSPDKPEPLPPGAVSNRLNGRGEIPANATILLFDQLNTAWVDENFAHQQVLKFIRSLGEKDRLALYSLEKELRVVQDFTNDRDQLLAGATGLKALVDPRVHDDPAERPRSRTEAKMQQEERRVVTVDHARITQTALEAIARHLAGLPGRKSLVWLADSFIPDPDPDLLRKLEDANIAIYLVDAHGQPPAGVSPELERPQIFARRARGRGTNDATQAEETIADSTGGLALYHTNDLSGSIRKAIDDAAATYVLGFYPADKTLDSTFHKLTVKVAKKGLDVRHRQDYFAFQEQAPTDQQLRETLAQLVGEPLDATAIGLMAGMEGDRQLALKINLGDLHLDQKDEHWVGAIDVAIHFDKETKMNLQTFNLQMTRDQLLAALKSGFVLRKTIPGSQTGDVRVVVQDRATGAAGSLGLHLK